MTGSQADVSSWSRGANNGANGVRTGPFPATRERIHGGRHQNGLHRGGLRRTLRAELQIRRLGVRVPPRVPALPDREAPIRSAPDGGFSSLQSVNDFPNWPRQPVHGRFEACSAGALSRNPLLPLDQLRWELGAVVPRRREELVLRCIVVVESVHPAVVDPVDGVDRSHATVELAPYTVPEFELALASGR